MTQHTPGPWIVRNMSDTTTSKEAFCERYTVEVCAAGLRSVLADIREVTMCPEHGGTAEANARLIAAAPELLETLKVLRARAIDIMKLSNQYDGQLIQAIHNAEQAIAKAKGASNG